MLKFDEYYRYGTEMREFDIDCYQSDKIMGEFDIDCYQSGRIMRAPPIPKSNTFRFRVKSTAPPKPNIYKFQQIIRKTESPNIKYFLKYKYVPKLLQHIQTCLFLKRQNPLVVYYIASPKEHYDAISFNYKDFPDIVLNKDINLLNFYKYKMESNLNVVRALKMQRKYSFIDFKGVKHSKKSLRSSVDYLKIGTLGDRRVYKGWVRHLSYPVVKVKDYSDCFVNLVRHPNGSLGPETILTYQTLTGAIDFCKLMSRDSEILLEVNKLVKENLLYS